MSKTDKKKTKKRYMQRVDNCYIVFPLYTIIWRLILIGILYSDLKLDMIIS